MEYDVLERYVSLCKLQIANAREMHAYEVPMNEDNTSIAFAWYEDGVFKFRFHTEVIGSPFPIAQYVTIGCDGKMQFRDSMQWFVPMGTDVCFDSFSKALKYARICGEPQASQEGNDDLLLK